MITATRGSRWAMRSSGTSTWARTSRSSSSGRTGRCIRNGCTVSIIIWRVTSLKRQKTSCSTSWFGCTSQTGSGPSSTNRSRKTSSEMPIVDAKHWMMTRTTATRSWCSCWCLTPK
uniref:(northern house mosquito) hypothetical protein n=1 Tax=Culex pipiens TaxID=7175 RepID=A0A8D8CRI1_CULPI